MRRITAISLAWCLACGTLSAQTSVSAALSRAHSRPPVNARLLLRVDDTGSVIGSEVTLLGRDGDVLLAQSAQTGAALSRIEKARVVRCEFLFDYDRSAVATALQANDWSLAVRVLSPVARLAFPYLDLQENNGLELAMELGTYMVYSADREMRVSTNNVAGRERALKQYEAAHEVFRQAARADWTPLGQVASLKGCRALIAQGKESLAADRLEEVAAPVPGEASYGHYWLVRAELCHRAGKFREALDAAAKALVFADKDIETFPASILLSAACHAELGSYHRARDMYYEVAVLFVGTDWATDALAGLADVMASKKTQEAEQASLENVFFKVSDDMNKLSEELLKARGASKSGAGDAKADL